MDRKIGSSCSAIIALSLDLRPCAGLVAFKAALNGRTDRCRLLLKYGKLNLDHILVAARWGHLEAAQVFIEAGANVNSTLHHGKRGSTVLNAAVENPGNRSDGNISVIRFLLDKGADPDRIDYSLEIVKSQEVRELLTEWRSKRNR